MPAVKIAKGGYRPLSPGLTRSQIRENTPEPPMFTGDPMRPIPPSEDVASNVAPQLPLLSGYLQSPQDMPLLAGGMPVAPAPAVPTLPAATGSPTTYQRLYPKLAPIGPNAPPEEDLEPTPIEATHRKFLQGKYDATQEQLGTALKALEDVRNDKSDEELLKNLPEYTDKPPEFEAYGAAPQREALEAAALQDMRKQMALMQILGGLVGSGGAVSDITNTLTSAAVQGGGTAADIDVKNQILAFEAQRGEVDKRNLLKEKQYEYGGKLVDQRREAILEEYKARGLRKNAVVASLGGEVKELMRTGLGYAKELTKDEQNAYKVGMKAIENLMAEMNRRPAAQAPDYINQINAIQRRLEEKFGFPVGYLNNEVEKAKKRVGKVEEMAGRAANAKLVADAAMGRTITTRKSVEKVAEMQDKTRRWALDRSDKTRRYIAGITDARTRQIADTNASVALTRMEQDAKYRSANFQKGAVKFHMDQMASLRSLLLRVDTMIERIGEAISFDETTPTFIGKEDKRKEALARHKETLDKLQALRTTYKTELGARSDDLKEGYRRMMELGEGMDFPLTPATDGSGLTQIERLYPKRNVKNPKPGPNGPTDGGGWKTLPSGARVRIKP